MNPRKIEIIKGVHYASSFQSGDNLNAKELPNGNVELWVEHNNGSGNERLDRMDPHWGQRFESFTLTPDSDLSAISDDHLQEIATQFSYSDLFNATTRHVDDENCKR